jgi:hypothetical protein
MKRSVLRGCRVLVGPTEIAGYYSNLVRGLSACGSEAIYGIIHGNNFAYGYEHPRGLLRQRCLNLWSWAENNRSNRLLWLYARMLHRLVAAIYFFCWLPRLDAVIYGFGHSYLPFNLDLPLLRLCGKKVIVNLGHGSDLRPPYVDGSYLLDDASDFVSVEQLVAIARRLRHRVMWLEFWSTWVIGAPLSSSLFATKPFINWFAVGIPFSDTSDPKSESISASQVDFVSAKSRVLRIVHAPSKPAVKGSALIRQSVNNLQRLGYQIDYRELQGRPNHEVLDELQRCDLVLDQMYSDTPMAGLAVEAAFFGKPSLVAGYGLNRLKQLLPKAWCPPTFTCHPEDFEASLQKLLAQPERLRDVGNQARDFVKNVWGSTLVAQRYLRLIAHDVPCDWWFDPRDVSYLLGCGLPEKMAMQSVSRVLRIFGLKGLQLSHRPDLEQAYHQFVHSGLFPFAD